MKDELVWILLVLLIVESFVIIGFGVQYLHSISSSSCIELETNAYDMDLMQKAIELSNNTVYQLHPLFIENGDFVGFLFQDGETLKWLYIGTTEYPSIFQGGIEVL